MPSLPWWYWILAVAAFAFLFYTERGRESLRYERNASTGHTHRNSNLGVLCLALFIAACWPVALAQGALVAVLRLCGWVLKLVLRVARP